MKPRTRKKTRRSQSPGNAAARRTRTAVRGVTEKVAPDRGETTRRRSPAGGKAGETWEDGGNGSTSGHLLRRGWIHAHVVAGNCSGVVDQPLDVGPQVLTRDLAAGRGLNRQGMPRWNTSTAQP